MAIAPCNTAVDSSQRELVQHGTTAFPIACYHDDFRSYEVPWHWHEEWEAAVILEGSALIAAGKEKYVLHAGEGFFVNSQILHGCWDLDGSGSQFHSIVFHPRLIGGSLDSVFYQNYVQPLTENHALESLHLKPAVPWQREALAAIESTWQACAQEPYGLNFRHEITCRSWRSCCSAIPLLPKSSPAPKRCGTENGSNGCSNTSTSITRIP